MRQTSIDAITDGRLTKRTARSGSVTLQALSRIVPNSFLDIDGDTASLNAAVVLTPQTTLDISGVKTLKLGGGDSPTEAAFLYTGSGRILVDGVTVTSADKDGQPLAMSAQGRPYIVVSSRGRFEATDATLSDLGVQPTGTDKGDPGISFNTDSAGALVRTQLLRNTTGAELSKSKNIKLEGVTASRVVVGRSAPAGRHRHDADRRQGRAQRRQRRHRHRRELGARDPRHRHQRQPLLRGGRGRPDEGRRSTTSRRPATARAGCGSTGAPTAWCATSPRRTSRSGCSCT